MKNVLRNTWYVAGWADELKAGAMLARRLLDEPVVMFRDPQGTAHALFDRCPHRFAPLSLGKLCDGGSSVQCIYHGLRYDTRGQCVHNPHGDGTIPKAAVVKRYPIAERYSALWIWMGDPERADPSLIPNFDFLETKDWAVGTGYLGVDGHYELENDNILDLSHIEFLHPIFTSDQVSRGELSCEQEGDTVWSKRVIRAEDPPRFLRDAFQVPDGDLVDRWLDVRWDAPAQLALWVRGTVSGRPRSEAVVIYSAHLFTPESDSRTHYFYAGSFPRSLGPMAEELAKHSVAALRQPFEFEDKPLIEAVARRMEGADLWSLKPVLLPGDAPAVRARRVLQALIAAEGAARP